MRYQDNRFYIRHSTHQNSYQYEIEYGRHHSDSLANYPDARCATSWHIQDVLVLGRLLLGSYNCRV